MAPNKFMHPRNIYKIPPNFSELALKYPEFLQVSKLDVSGKVHIDFKDPDSLRVLTKCLLHSDFGLNVYIPEDRLVPTLPLRLNYILWLEDLLGTLDTGEQVAGIDIGTGACAIYPLLGACKNQWRMIGTESDELSYRIANDNVKENNLDNLITVKHSATESLLEHCFTDDKEAKYDFCMCNPPFYGSFQELCESRGDARPPPKNAFTGSLAELITEGGEVEFIKKLFAESNNLKENVKIFTSMVGHKSSLKELVAELRQRGVRHTHTEFCQGRTTRWGLAWTFLHECNLQAIAPPKSESRKKNTSMAFVIPPHPTVEYNTESVSQQIKKVLAQLGIRWKILKKKGCKVSMEITAHTNTWSNQRRKRRQMKRLEMDTKRQKVVGGNGIEIVVVENNNIDCKQKHSNESEDKLVRVSEESTIVKTVDHLKNDKEDKLVRISEESKIVKTVDHLKNDTEDKIVRVSEESTTVKTVDHLNLFVEPSASLPSTDEEVLTSQEIVACTSREKVTEDEKEMILQSILTIGKHEDDIILDMEFLSGSAGKDGMHQVVQYIKNNWK